MARIVKVEAIGNLATLEPKAVGLLEPLADGHRCGGELVCQHRGRRAFSAEPPLRLLPVVIDFAADVTSRGERNRPNMRPLME
jgi:hypothetical protein